MSFKESGHNVIAVAIMVVIVLIVALTMTVSSYNLGPRGQSAARNSERRQADISAQNEHDLLVQKENDRLELEAKEAAQPEAIQAQRDATVAKGIAKVLLIATGGLSAIVLIGWLTFRAIKWASRKAEADERKAAAKAEQEESRAEEARAKALKAKVQALLVEMDERGQYPAILSPDFFQLLSGSLQITERHRGGFYVTDINTGQTLSLTSPTEISNELMIAGSNKVRMLRAETPKEPVLIKE